MQNEYLDKVAALLKNKRAKVQILSELESHIEEKIDYYREIGYDEEESQKRALEEMGDPEETAISLNSLHNEKWYKIPFNIITVLILITIAVILMVCPQKFAYCDIYFNVVHDITFDLISLGIFSTYVVLLILARRFKSKFVPIAIAVFLILQIITPVLIMYVMQAFAPSNVNGPSGTLVNWLFSLNYPEQVPQRAITSVFQPFLYGIFTLFTKGPSAYIDSLFGYAYISDSYSVAFTVGTVLIYALLIIWSIFSVINVVRGERMKNTKYLNRTLKIGGKILAVFTAVCVAVTVSSTIRAYSEIDYKISENQRVREQMINCAANIDFSKSYDEIVDEMKKIKMGSLSNDEYRLEYSYFYGKHIDVDKPFGYSKDNNFIELIYDDDRNKAFAVMYATTTFGIDSPLNKYLYVKTEDLREFRDRASKSPTTYEEFLESGWQNYASEIEIREDLKCFIFLRDPESEDYSEKRTTIYILFDENNLMDFNEAAMDEFGDYAADWYEEEKAADGQ